MKYAEVLEETKKFIASKYVDLCEADLMAFYQPQQIADEVKRARRIEEIKKSAEYHADCKAEEIVEKFVSKCEAKVGEIIDGEASFFMGEINGVFVGEKGKISVQTFCAGGYNIQSFHYRTKLTVLKD